MHWLTEALACQWEGGGATSRYQTLPDPTSRYRLSKSKEQTLEAATASHALPCLAPKRTHGGKM